MQKGTKSTKSAVHYANCHTMDCRHTSADTSVTACTLPMKERIFVVVLTKLAVYARVSLESNQEIMFLHSNQYDTFEVPQNKGLEQNRSLPRARTHFIRRCGQWR